MKTSMKFAPLFASVADAAALAQAPPEVPPPGCNNPFLTLGYARELAYATMAVADSEGPFAGTFAAPHAAWPSAQRLGSLLDRLGASAVTGPLAAYVASMAPVTTPLDPRLPKMDAERDARWRLAINADVEA